MSTILVTGGTGFVGSRCVLQLLEQGHAVRTTVRNLDRESEVVAMLKAGGVEPGNRLTLFAADLEKDNGWEEAVSGCDYVLHVASPFPPGTPKNEDDLIVPAREGTLRVLGAARDAGVKRVVLTSSFAAVAYGHKPQTQPFTETDWTDLEGDDVQVYMKSKTLAERAAWDFVEKEGDSLELSVVNPVGVFGPLLGRGLSSSISLIKQMMDGGMAGCPRIYFGVVDVRDLADLHIRAMTNPQARGERFIAVAGECVSMLDVAKLLKSNMGGAAKSVPDFELPDTAVRAAAKVTPALQQVVPQLGIKRTASNEKARSILGWTPRSNEETILATAESLVTLGLLKTSQ